MQRLLPILALLLACDVEPASPTDLDSQASTPAAAAPGQLAAADVPEQILQVHWVHLPSFDELLRQSQVVVRGEVVSTGFDAIRHPDKDDPRVYSDLPLTISGLAVREVLLGTMEASDAVSEVIEVQEIGGPMADGAFAYPDDKPPLRPGEEVVLCLRIGENGRYSVVGGNQGRFGVVGGKLDPLFTGEDFGRFDGAPLERLTAAIATFTGSRG